MLHALTLRAGSGSGRSSNIVSPQSGRAGNDDESFPAPGLTNVCN
jgi:hypothetical protein